MFVINEAGRSVSWDSLSPEEQSRWRARSSQQIRDLEQRRTRPALKVDVTLTPEQKRARSRANLDQVKPDVTWANTTPRLPDPMAAPKPRQRFEDMDSAQQELIREIM